jgi:hypothetical protein
MLGDRSRKATDFSAPWLHTANAEQWGQEQWGLVSCMRKLKSEVQLMEVGKMR